MGDFIIYELKVAVVLAAFYLCFKWLLSGEKMHRLNRIVLVSTSVLSFILPLCVITVHKTVQIATPALSETSIQASESAQELAPRMLESARPISWEIILIVIYWAGVLIILGNILLSILRVMKLIRNGMQEVIDGTEVTVCEGDVPPFSWMRWIVMGRQDFESGNRHILEHEKAHIKLRHSKEVLLFDIMSAFQWFNPAVWLLRRELRSIHEYEADDTVLRSGANIKEYQYSLIRKAVSASGYSITNSFNHSILKNRITMMSKSNASRTRWLRALYVLPLLCGALAINARTITDYKFSENPSSSKTDDSTVRIELKKDSEGEYRCFVINGSVTYNGVFDAISSLMDGDKSTIVEIVAPGDVKYGVIADLKQVLRGMPGLRVKYICSDEESWSNDYHTPESEANTKISETGVEVLDHETEHLCLLKISNNDMIFFGKGPSTLNSLQTSVLDVIEHDHKTVISMQADRGTSYFMIAKIDEIIMNAYEAVRNSYAMKTYGKNLSQLSEEELVNVKAEIPVQVCELTPNEAK